MKRHMDLITKILRYVENDQTGDWLEIPSVFDSYTGRQVHEHLKLCEEAGFLVIEETSVYQDQEGFYPLYKVLRLTWQGHEFLNLPKRKRLGRLKLRND